MTRATNIEGSILGRHVGIRFGREVFDALTQHLLRDSRDEQFAFGLFSMAKTADGTMLVVQDIVLPDAKDLSEQSGGGVAPTKNFQATVYMLAQQQSLGILDVHTHPFGQVPRFSGIDEAESAKNAKYICEKFPDSTTHAMIVFGQAAKAHDATIYDRSLNAFRNVDFLEVLGRRIKIRPTGESCTPGDENDPRYSRQVMIPGWDQVNIARQRIAVIGAGGNGAQIIQTLVSVGAGTEGWIAAIDPDIVEESNLPRIPYAFAADVGSPKVTVAAHYACQKNPRVRFYPYPCSVTEKAAKDRVKAATVIFGAVDGDGIRKICNEWAVRYLIPYIDLGCDIQVEAGKVEAGGQVRVVLPGSNACLVCCGGFDPAAAAVELMDDARAAVHAAHGYVRGTRDRATPSVANLNATTAQLGMAAFLALVHGKRFGNWDYAHYDQLTAQTILANTKQREDCPLCGPKGLLAAGDEHDEEEPLEPEWSAVGAKK